MITVTIGIATSPQPLRRNSTNVVALIQLQPYLQSLTGIHIAVHAQTIWEHTFPQSNTPEPRRTRVDSPAHSCKCLNDSGILLVGCSPRFVTQKAIHRNQSCINALLTETQWGPKARRPPCTLQGQPRISESPPPFESRAPSSLPRS